MLSAEVQLGDTNIASHIALTASLNNSQKRDIDIATVIELKRVGQKLTKRQISKDSQYVRKLLYDWNRLIMKNGILYRVSNMNSETTYQSRRASHIALTASLNNS
jgi:hypothetical protein